MLGREAEPGVQLFVSLQPVCGRINAIRRSSRWQLNKKTLHEGFVKFHVGNADGAPQ